MTCIWCYDMSILGPVTTTSTGELTFLLRRWGSGDPDALAVLMPLVYQDLRRMASRYLRGEHDAVTLQPTALVHEVYLRLHGRRSVSFRNRSHFFGFAAQTLRRILVEHSRRHQAAKRGGGLHRASLTDPADHRAMSSTDILALDRALESLKRLDSRLMMIVQLRFFLGLTVEETATALGISAITVKRDWRTARLWLYREMSGAEPSSAAPAPPSAQQARHGHRTNVRVSAKGWKRLPDGLK